MPVPRNIAVIDYGAGNVRSVANALASLGYHPDLTADPARILKAGAILFPGVGAGPSAMRELDSSGMSGCIRQVIAENRPFLAICIGMQVLFDSTQEGRGCDCLGIIPGEVRRIPPGPKIPHMGWNRVKQHIRHPVFDGIPDGASFYFVHSYCGRPADPTVVAGTTEYGVTLCSMIIKGNLFATQFHPEKSGKSGLRMFANFLEYALGNQR